MGECRRLKPKSYQVHQARQFFRTKVFPKSISHKIPQIRNIVVNSQRFSFPERDVREGWKITLPWKCFAKCYHRTWCLWCVAIINLWCLMLLLFSQFDLFTKRRFQSHFEFFAIFLFRVGCETLSFLKLTIKIKPIKSINRLLKS